MNIHHREESNKHQQHQDHSVQKTHTYKAVSSVNIRIPNNTETFSGQNPVQKSENQQMKKTDKKKYSTLNKIQVKK